MSPRNKHPEETVQKILDVSLQLFLEKGYDRTSVLDIVQNLGGLTRGAFYHHFKSKEAVLAALAERLFSNTQNPFEKVKKETDLNGLQKIQKMMKYIFANDEQQEVHSIFLTIPLLNNPTFLVELIENNILSLGPAVQILIEEGLADGSIQPNHAKFLSEVFILVSNFWMIPSIYPISKQEFMEKVYFSKKLFENIGFPVFDDEMIEGFEKLSDKML